MEQGQEQRSEKNASIFPLKIRVGTGARAQRIFTPSEFGGSGSPYFAGIHLVNYSVRVESPMGGASGSALAAGDGSRVR